MAFPRSDNTVAWRTRVHIYELDSLGHVNNANYFPYLQQATGEAWPQAARWTLKRLSMEYLAPVLVGVELAIHIWMEDSVAAGWLTLGYAVVGQADSEVRLRARLAWDTGGDPDVWTAFPAADALPGQYQLRPVRPVEELPVARRFWWNHQVRGYETGSNGQVSAAQFLRWTEEARNRAAEEAGWNYQRLQNADFMGVVTRHDLAFEFMPRAGDQVKIVSRIYEARKVRGTWQHELFCDGTLAATALVGVGFLNPAGQPHRPPQALIDGLITPTPPSPSPV